MAGRPVAITRADGTHKPSYAVLDRLIRGEWWLPARTTRTDRDGRVTLVGCAGTYSVMSTGNSAVFELAHGTDAVSVTLA